jgi:hypothetical protein
VGALSAHRYSACVDDTYCGITLNPTPFSFNEAPGPFFRHDKLDLNRKSFRLLELQPILQVSNRDESHWYYNCTYEAKRTWAKMPHDDMYIIQCKLVTAYFNDKAEDAYSALSYEWGPAEPPFYWIRTNDRYLRVRKNLHSFLRSAHIALRSERDQDVAKLLWIDAICIDQNNV